ncbi:MAG: hypothetical protein NC917_04550 [Candidatus Omnitrophica bacterium]|nr:hypothetical protein [Candidatus Omnitrophota bacterium]
MSEIKDIKKTIIGALGITYKQNIKDIIKSPSLHIVEKICRLNKKVLVCYNYTEKKI